LGFSKRISRGARQHGQREEAGANDAKAEQSKSKVAGDGP
jgi:hypothetical protein